MNLTAEYAPDRRAVIVNVTGTSTEPRIMRLDANGRHDVRKPGNTYHTPAGPTGGSWRAYDREHALTGPVRYVATAGAARVIYEATGLEAAPAGPLLSNPVGAGADLEALQVSDIAGERAASSVLHEVIGLASPVVTFDVLRLRVGTLSLLVRSYADAARLAGMAGTATLHLRQRTHPGLDMYFTASSAAVAPAAPGAPYWTVTMGYQETDAPAGNAVDVNAWSWNTVKSEHSSFDDVYAGYLTWADLADGRVL